MGDHEVSDGGRTLQFDGVQLGSATSFRDGKDRWIEVSIFKTEAGTYIVAGIGKSVVTGETDRHWAHVCDKPQDVVDRLRMYGEEDGQWYIPLVSRRALEEACGNDTHFAEVFQPETVD